MKESHASNRDTPGKEPCSKEVIPHRPHIPWVLDMPGVGEAAWAAHPGAARCSCSPR